jgi:hypothetical protein
MKVQHIQAGPGFGKPKTQDELTRREPLESIEVKLPLERRKLGLTEPPVLVEK